MLPDCKDDLIDQDSPVRVIDAFVDNLELAKTGFTKGLPLIKQADRHMPPHDLLKLYIYGYFKRML